MLNVIGHSYYTMLSPQTQIVTKRELSMHFKELDNTKTTRTLSIHGAVIARLSFSLTEA